MSRFHLYASSGNSDYLLDMQSDFLEHYNSRVVAPVVSVDRFDGAAVGLNPILEYDGAEYVVLTHFLSAVPARDLKVPLADFSAEADRFTRALDLLFQGY